MSIKPSLFVYSAVISLILALGCLRLEEVYNERNLREASVIFPSDEFSLERAIRAGQEKAVDDARRNVFNSNDSNKKKYLDQLEAAEAELKASYNETDTMDKVYLTQDRLERMYEDSTKLSLSVAAPDTNDGNFIFPLLIAPRKSAPAAGSGPDRGSSSAESYTDQIEADKPAEKRRSNFVSNRAANPKNIARQAPLMEDTLSLSYPTHLGAKDTAYIKLEYAQLSKSDYAEKKALTDKNVENTGQLKPDFSNGITLVSDVCPPGTMLTQCFPDHEVQVATELTGIGFEIDSSSVNKVPRSLKSNYKQWQWLIKPKQNVEGPQDVALALNFSWSKPGHNIGPAYTIPATLRINIEPPMFDTGPFRIAEIVLFALTIIFTTSLIPAIIRKLKKWHAESGEEETIRIYKK